jgi:toxin ParE1/3/4
VRIEWKAAAHTDALDIADYIEIDNPTAALAIYEEIYQQIAMLADHPYLGRSGRVRGTRELVISRTPYIAAYQVASDVVTVLRVIHGARRWPRKLE